MFARVAASAACGAGAARRAAVRQWVAPAGRLGAARFAPALAATAERGLAAGALCSRREGRERSAWVGAGQGASAEDLRTWRRAVAAPLPWDRRAIGVVRPFGTERRGGIEASGSDRASGANAARGNAENPSPGTVERAAESQAVSQEAQSAREASSISSSSSSSSSAPLPLVTNTWVDRAPAWSQPFLHLARADKPIGTWLLLWPCAWSIALAAPAGSLPDLRLLALFGAGAFLLRGAGCTINDLWDRDFDRRVERTRSRPLAAGTATVPGAVGFLVAQLLAGLQILLQLNPAAQVLGAASLPLVGAYPLAKRFIGAPQLVLGMAFNWGAHLGWVAAKGDGWMAHDVSGSVAGAQKGEGGEDLTGRAAIGSDERDAPLLAGAPATDAALASPLSPSTADIVEPSNLLSALFDPASLSALSAHLPELSPVALPLYLGCISWTLVYDTVYAHQDKDDDVKIGVKSTALTWGRYNRPIMATFAGLFGAGLVAAGAGAECWGPFYASAALATGLVAKQALATDLSDRPACGAAFVSNHNIGKLVFAGIVADKLTALL